MGALWNVSLEGWLLLLLIIILLLLLIIIKIKIMIIHVRLLIMVAPRASPESGLDESDEISVSSPASSARPEYVDTHVFT